jgi:hypothetical protein
MTVLAKATAIPTGWRSERVRVLYSRLARAREEEESPFLEASCEMSAS